MREIKFRAWDKEKINVRKGCKGMYKQNGYILAKAEYHPYANKRGYVPLHRLIVENELGRYLFPRKEIIHHIDLNRDNNDINNLKLTTPQKHYIEEHFEKRNPNGRFVADEPVFEDIKFRLFDKDNNLTQIYTLKELMSKTFRRSKFSFRGRYAGLKDKNGVEIYEGDILQASDLFNGVIEYHPTRAQYVGRNVGKSYQGDVFDTLYTSDGVFRFSKVIGNIYENPELLEGK